MFEYISAGKTISSAIENGLNQLGLTSEKVNIKIKKQPGNFTDAEVEFEMNEEVFNSLTTENQEKILAYMQKKNKKKHKHNILNDISVEQIKKSIDLPLSELNELGFQKLAEQFVSEALKTLNCQAFEISSVISETEISVNVVNFVAPNISVNKEFIGALQYLTNVFLNSLSRKAIKVALDINNFKKDQIENLKKQAENAMNEIDETTTYIALKPMNSFERHIIHDTVALNPNFSYESEGIEPERFVIIKKK